jgi:beta-aspartyl-peptidase (threonine type)
MPTRPAIVIHGGAWVRDALVEPAVIDGVAHAAQVGFDLLRKGGSALDAVEAAVVALEEDVHFNAGLGSCLTSEGTVEMDASIMDGATLGAGAVAIVRGVRNPIRLARRVMTDSGHLLLAGEGARRFAVELGDVEIVPDDWHVTPNQRARWDELRREADARGAADRRKLGTVGAVAVDLGGHVACATSTGGTAFKRAGRVGDTPIIGAGTYADGTAGAVSCTGHGESFIRLTTARAACDQMRSGLSPLVAAQREIAILGDRVHGDGGLIAVAPDGRAGWAMNTRRMSRAIMREGIEAPVALCDQDDTSQRP